VAEFGAETARARKTSRRPGRCGSRSAAPGDLGV